MIKHFEELGLYQQHKYNVMSNPNVLRYMEKIFRKVHVGSLAMYDEDFPYVVPMNHYYEDGCFYWHVAFEGKKIDLLRKNPKACYVVHGSVKPLGEHEKYYHQPWLSVICYGELGEETDVPTKIRILTDYALYYGGTILGVEQRAKVCHMIKFSIDKMTARYGAFTPAENRTLMLWSFKEAFSLEGTGEMDPLPEI